MSEKNKIKVTIERYDEVIDLYDSFNLLEVTTKRAYEYLCLFVVDENDKYVGAELGAKYFKDNRIKRGEIGALWFDFVKKTGEAFVPPPNGTA